MFRYEATDHNCAANITSSLQKDHGITHLDIVIANAGYFDWRGPTASINPETIHAHIDVNTIAPIILFSATLPLLQNSKQEPKFFAISSAIGSISWIPKLSHAQVVAYGMSKAAMNYAFVKLNLEHEDIDVELLTPGPVATDLIRSFRPVGGGQRATVPNMVNIDDSVNGLMRCIDGATKKETGGGFRQWDGSSVPW